MVVGLVAPRVAARTEPVRDPPGVLPRGLQPRVVDVDAARGHPAGAGHARVLPGGDLEHHPTRVAGAERLDRLSALPSSDRQDVAVADWRLHVRVLVVRHVRADRSAEPGAGRAVAGVRVAGPEAARALDQPALVRDRDGRQPRRPVPVLAGVTGDQHDVRGVRAAGCVRADRAPALADQPPRWNRWRSPISWRWC